MKVKTVEIRDRATFIPAVAISIEPDNEGQRYLIRRSGFSSTFSDVILMPLDCRGASYDPYKWHGARTLLEAHLWIRTHFDEIKDGDVVDVEFILGEKPSMKTSERDDVFV